MELLPTTDRGTDGKETKITERTFVSIHLVAIIVVLAIWIVRLGDHVDAQSKELTGFQIGLKSVNDLATDLDKRVLKLEIKTGVHRAQIE